MTRAAVLGGHGAQIKIPEWENAAVAKVLSHVETQEAVNTFNMGFGWVAIVSPDQVEAAISAGAGGTTDTLTPCFARIAAFSMCEPWW